MLKCDDEQEREAYRQILLARKQDLLKNAITTKSGNPIMMNDTELSNTSEMEKMTCELGTSTGVDLALRSGSAWLIMRRLLTKTSHSPE
jgi:hypothetical protein